MVVIGWEPAVTLFFRPFLFVLYCEQLPYFLGLFFLYYIVSSYPIF